MIQAINFNFNKRSTLQNKGVRHAIVVSNSLMDESKKVEKKLAKYLVVPNNLRYFFRLSSLKNLMQHKASLRLYFLIKCKHLLN